MATISVFFANGVEAKTTAKIVATPPSHSTTALSVSDRAFKTAYGAVGRKNTAAFELAASRVSPKHLLYDYIGYWRLYMQLTTQDDHLPINPRLEHAARRFIGQHPRALAGDLLRRQWLIDRGRRNQWHEFTHHFARWKRRNDTRVYCQLGRARLASGKRPGERALNALNNDKNFADDCGVLARELLAQKMISLQTLRERFWRALERRNWRAARKIGDLIHIDQKRFSRALRRPKKLLSETLAKHANPTDKTPRLADNERDVLLTAFAYLGKYKPVVAADLLEKIGPLLGEQEQRFAWSQIAASAMRDMIPEAYGYAKKSLNAPAHDRTRRWLARASLREHDWQLLTTVIGEMSATEQSKSTWVYWRARALKAEGSNAGAQALFARIADRHDFYGRLAAEELGRLVAPPDAHRGPTKSDLKKVERLAGIQRALKFFALDIRYHGNREWNFQVRNMRDRQLIAVATFACNRHLLERCISTAERTEASHDFALRFISPYRQAVASAARENGLDLAWVYGLIRQESRFRVRAHNAVGARGLMQIMPATGRWIARKLGVRGHKTRHLLDLSTNVNFGTYYLRAVYNNLQNSPLLASAAYNAGPRRPQRWLTTLQGEVDGALFVEIIPFNETRTYVKKVLLNTTYYAAVFSGRPQSLKGLLGKVSLAPYKTIAVP